MADAVAEAPPAGLRANLLDLIANEPQLPPSRPGRTRPRRSCRSARPPAQPLDRRRARPRPRRSRSSSGRGRDAGRRRHRSGRRGRRGRRRPDDPDAGYRRGRLAARRHDRPTRQPENAAVLMADHVPVPEGNRVDVLGRSKTGPAEGRATFRPDASGTLSVYAQGLDPASAEPWAITEEPAGGSDAPTTPILKHHRRSGSGQDPDCDLRAQQPSSSRGSVVLDPAARPARRSGSAQ